MIQVHKINKLQASFLNKRYTETYEAIREHETQAYQAKRAWVNQYVNDRIPKFLQTFSKWCTHKGYVKPIKVITFVFGFTTKPIYEGARLSDVAIKRYGIEVAKYSKRLDKVRK